MEFSKKVKHRKGVLVLEKNCRKHPTVNSEGRQKSKNIFTTGLRNFTGKQGSMEGERKTVVPSDLVQKGGAVV